MKTPLQYLSLLFAAGSLIVAATTANAQGILNTKHNLSSTVGSGVDPLNPRRVSTTATTEVCVFCHTPHGSDGDVNRPLWNRALPTSTFTMYNSVSLDSAPDPNKLGISLACLSCHDGTIAFDALRNGPGPGDYDETAQSRNWTWSNGWSKMQTGWITNIGTDLSNDHPIAMDYSAAMSPSSASQTNDHATGFNEPDATTKIFSTGVKLVKDGGAGTTWRVQCVSCHDPHRSNTKTFLRTSNDGSALCLTCHKKNVDS